ncbi:hypothetical protein [Photobacterium galatheae]|nr:hypothetical protein [Photobacterium galatheae]MCM0148172.1 hypothetical protein [Photobacterium galatheae]
MSCLLAACSPAEHAEAHLHVRFLTHLPPSPGKADLDVVALPPQEGITFYSAQNPKVESQPFSYVTAITPETKLYSDSASLLPQASYPVLASNIDFGLRKNGDEVYSYNSYKGRADAFIRWYGSSRVAFLALINPYPGNEGLHERDLTLLRNSVDRLQEKGIRNIVLLSQYPTRFSPELLKTIRGVDVVISAGQQTQTTVASKRCIAEFSQTKPDQLTLIFDPKGQINTCSFPNEKSRFNTEAAITPKGL